MASRALAKLMYPLFKLYWFIFRPKAHGVKCVIQNDGRILMIRNTYGHKFWTFPGGGVDKGETAEQAIRREIMEEVGVTVRDLRKIGAFFTTAEHKKDTVTVFTGESDGDQLKIDKGEILEARWFLPDKLPITSQYAQKVLVMWDSNGR